MSLDIKAHFKTVFKTNKATANVLHVPAILSCIKLSATEISNLKLRMETTAAFKLISDVEASRSKEINDVNNERKIRI